MDRDELRRQAQSGATADAQHEGADPHQGRILRLMRHAALYHQRHAAFVEEFNELTGGTCRGQNGGVSYMAVRRWQLEHGTRVDGMVGPETLTAARQSQGAEKDSAAASNAPSHEKATQAAGSSEPEAPQSSAQSSTSRAGNGEAEQAKPSTQETRQGRGLPEPPDALQEQAAPDDAPAGEGGQGEVKAAASASVQHAPAAEKATAPNKNSPAPADSKSSPPKVPLADAYTMLTPVLAESALLKGLEDGAAVVVDCGTQLFDGDGTIKAALLESNGRVKTALAFLAVPGATWESHAAETVAAFEILLEPMVHERKGRPAQKAAAAQDGTEASAGTGQEKAASTSTSSATTTGTLDAPKAKEMESGTAVAPTQSSAGGGESGSAPAQHGSSAAAHSKQSEARGISAVEDHGKTTTEEILRPEEIFRDVGKNTVHKKQAFNSLSAAVKTRQHAQAKLNNATTPKAREAAEKELAAAAAQVTVATEHLKEFIVESRLPEDLQIKDLKDQLRDAKRHHDTAQATQIKAALQVAEQEARARIRAEVDAMKHSDRGHEGESAFEPEKTEVGHHDFVFPDGEHVKVRDHVVAYATTAALGVDSDADETKAEKKQSRADVQTRMDEAGLSNSKAKILKAISGFEGGFDTVNTYDRAKVTWGFVQWTGGSHSDLTKALTIIKQSCPEAFARSFQAYGIDIEKDRLVISPPDGSGQLVGAEAAEALMKNPLLAAALSHAGRDKDVQKGEVKAAEQIEIEAALEMKVKAEKHEISTKQLITSEYGVGLLANTYVHSGSGAAQSMVQSGLAGFVAEHGFHPDDDAWATRAEAAIVALIAAHDSDRAAQLATMLNKERGSFKS